MGIAFRHATWWDRTAAAPGGDQTPPQFTSGEQGDVGHTTLRVQFSEPVNSDLNDYVTGVTIKYNAITQTIVSGTRQVDQSQVDYVITPTADINDAITWEYASGPGDIEDQNNNPLGDVTAQAVTNNVGTHAIFDNEWDSAHAFFTASLLYG